MNTSFINELNITLTMKTSNNQEVDYTIKYNAFGKNMLTIFQRQDNTHLYQEGKCPFMREWEWIEVFKHYREKFDWHFASTKIEELYEYRLEDMRAHHD